MPQVTSKEEKLNLQPYGRGSLRSDLIDVTFKAHQRINKVNEGVGSRLKVVIDVMDRHQELEQTRMLRTIGRMRQHLEKFKAYQRVLNSYKVDNLRTLEHGFNKRAAMTPHTERRCKSESRLYFAGFSMHALQFEVDDMIQKIQPQNQRGEKQQKLLRVSKRRSNFVIDRKMTNEALKKERFAAILSDKKDKKNADKPEKEASGKIPNNPSAHRLTVFPDVGKVTFEGKG